MKHFLFLLTAIFSLFVTGNAQDFPALKVFYTPNGGLKSAGLLTADSAFAPPTFADTPAVGHSRFGGSIIRVASGGDTLLYEYDASNTTWRHLGYAGLNAAVSGTTNYVAKFTAANTVGNSLTQDDGTGVGVGGAPVSTFMLNTYGNFRSYNTGSNHGYQTKLTTNPDFEGINNGNVRSRLTTGTGSATLAGLDDPSKVASITLDATNLKVYTNSGTLFSVGGSTNPGSYGFYNPGTTGLGNVLNFTTSDTRIVHAANYGNIQIGAPTNSIGGSTLRAIQIGDNNNASAVTGAPYIIQIGYNNALTTNKFNYQFGQSNFNSSSQNDNMQFGSSNYIQDGYGNFQFGNANYTNHNGTTVEQSTFIYGSYDSALHKRCFVSGIRQATTAENQLIIGARGGNLTDGLNDVYFGTGPRQALLYADYIQPVTINANGAAKDVDKNGGALILAGGKATGAGTGGDVMWATASTLTSGSTLQSLTNRWKVKFNTGNLVDFALTDNTNDRIQSGGSILAKGYTEAINTISANTTITNAYSFVAVDATSGNITLDITTTGITAGRVFTVKKVAGANNVIIDPAGAATVDGAASKTLSTLYSTAVIIFDGTNFLVKAEF